MSLGSLKAGDIVLVTFPFSDLSDQKIRPALVTAKAEFNNFILCQITSKSYSSKQAIQIEAADFAQGSLPITSYVRPDKLFTADTSIIRRSVGTLTQTKRDFILSSIRELF